MSRRPAWASLALWVGGGSFGGLALGALISDADAAMGHAPLWLLLGVVYFGSILFVTRRSGHEAEAPAPAAGPTASATPIRQAAPSAARSGARQGLQLSFTFPEIPDGFPPVMGENEPILVRLHVTHMDQPAEGAAVRLSGALRDGARIVAGEGVTGTGGSVAITVKPQHTGELVLEAEASLDGHSGSQQASLGIVRYEEEIERLFNEFRAYAVGVLGAQSEADTARELCEKLRERADAETSRALFELARIYELVAYGERTAHRKLYLAQVAALLVLEGAPLSQSDAPGVHVEG